MTPPLTAEPVTIEMADGVATVTMNRPDSLNSLNVALKVALREAFDRLAADRSCRAVVLAGAGRAFCAGQDLREHIASLEAAQSGEDAGPADPLSTVRRHYNPMALALARMPKPVVAAVGGMAAGAGAGLAFLCDFRIGGPKTGFLMAFATVGLAADTAISWTLPRLVGHAKATELLMLAAPIGADEASRLGLLTQLVEDDAQILTAAQTLAARLATGPTVAYAQIKRELLDGATGSLIDALEVEAQAQTASGVTADHRDSVAAFVAKRTPAFHGR